MEFVYLIWSEYIIGISNTTFFLYSLKVRVHYPVYAMYFIKWLCTDMISSVEVKCLWVFFSRQCKRGAYLRLPI